MFLGGMKVCIVEPVKIFTTVFKQTKSKVGKRMIRVKKHTGWCELLKDGQVIEHKPSNTYNMNKFTFNKLKTEMISRKIERPGDFLSRQMWPY